MLEKLSIIKQVTSAISSGNTDNLLELAANTVLTDGVQSVVIKKENGKAKIIPFKTDIEKELIFYKRLSENYKQRLIEKTIEK